MSDDLDIGPDDDLGPRLRTGFEALADAASGPPPLPDQSDALAPAASNGSRRMVLAAAAVVIALAVGAAVVVASRGDRKAERVITEPDRPSPAPVGVLVPAEMATVGDQGSLAASGTFDGYAFQLEARRGDHSLSWVSKPGTQLGEGGLPLRCAGATANAGGKTAEEATKVSGPAAHLTMLSNGSFLSVTAVSPSLLEVNPDALPGLPATEIEGSILLTPEQAVRLADQPGTSSATIHSWSHRFDGGLQVDAVLDGSLGREVSYRFELRADGLDGEGSTNTLGLRCNQRSPIGLNTPSSSYSLVLLNGGTSLRVDGHEVSDAQDDPVLQGRWAVLEVAKANGEVEAEVVDRSGKVIEHWTQQYRPPGSD